MGLAPSSLPHTLGYACALIAPTFCLPTHAGKLNRFHDCKRSIFVVPTRRAVIRRCLPSTTWVKRLNARYHSVNSISVIWLQSSYLVNLKSRSPKIMCFRSCSPRERERERPFHSENVLLFEIGVVRPQGRIAKHSVTTKKALGKPHHNTPEEPRRTPLRHPSRDLWKPPLTNKFPRRASWSIAPLRW